jgi:hypothetical protein
MPGLFVCRTARWLTRRKRPHARCRATAAGPAAAAMATSATPPTVSSRRKPGPILRSSPSRKVVRSTTAYAYASQDGSRLKAGMTLCFWVASCPPYPSYPRRQILPHNPPISRAEMGLQRSTARRLSGGRGYRCPSWVGGSVGHKPARVRFTTNPGAPRPVSPHLFTQGRI